MANLPEKPAQSSELATKEAFREKIADLIFSGMTPAQIARKMYPDDPKKRYNMRARLRRMLWADAELALAVGQRAKGQLIMDLGQTTVAVGRRGRRGRIDAAKLIYETTGFHNPKVKHEHSGDINIKIDMPRPKFHDAEGSVVSEDEA